MSTTPEHIMQTLRQRIDLAATDKTSDAELDALTPMDKLRHIAAWHLGDSQWADQIMGWAKDCGMSINSNPD